MQWNKERGDKMEEGNPITKDPRKILVDLRLGYQTNLSR